MTETFALVLLALVSGGTALAVVYILALTAFFRELRAGEPLVWQDIGSPTLMNMLCLPFWRFRKFYAFLPVLQARRNDKAYRHAGMAYTLLRVGLGYFVFLLMACVIYGLSL